MVTRHGTRGYARLFIAVSLFLASPSALAQQLTYNQFLKIALDQNLSLKMVSAKANAAASAAKALNIPPPTVGYMRMTDQSGSSADGFEVSQTIPFPTKIAQDKSVRKFHAEANDEARMASEADLCAKAKMIYFNLWSSKERKSALVEKKEILEDHIKLTRASVRSDSFLRIHLLKAESDLDLLDDDLIAADEDITEKEAQAARFLNVDVESFHPTLEDPPETPLPTLESLSDSHQLELTRLEVDGADANDRLARSSWFPDIYVKYQEVGKTQLMPETSDVTFGISLPFIFPWDRTAEVDEADANRAESEFEFEDEKRKIEAEESIEFSKATSLNKELDNITQRLIPRAKVRVKLIRNLAPRDMASLEDHLETMDALPNLELRALDLRTRYEAAVAALRKYQRGDK